jgi:hypothetical protein
VSSTNGNGQSDVTPSSGIDLAALRALNPSEAVVYLAEQIREQREEGQRHRAVSAKAAAYAEMATKAADRARDSAESTVVAIATLRADTHAELDAISGRVIVAFGAQSLAIQALKDALGEAPRTIDPKESRSGDHSPEQLAAMESGTGLAGIVGRMRAEQSRAARKQAISVGAAAAFAPVAVELIKAFF